MDSRICFLVEFQVKLERRGKPGVSGWIKVNQELAKGVLVTSLAIVEILHRTGDPINSVASVFTTSLSSPFPMYSCLVFPAPFCALAP
jgi:hypothetical protein